MTQKCILIGHPLGHSVSPAIHGAAYEQLGLDAVYELCDCPTEDDVRKQIDRILAGEVLGANVTVPHKLVALRAADVLHPSAEKIGAANVLLRTSEGKLMAQNTDASGLADELIEAKQELSGRLGGRRGALVVGSGGAALASVVAAQMAGFEKVWVTARRYDPRVPEEEWPHARRLTSLGARLLPWPGLTKAGLTQARQEIAAIIQATSAGMKGTTGGQQLAQVLELSEFEPLVAYDLVYNPSLTPFVVEARRYGHQASSGLGMLVGQAAHAIEIWFGKLPPKPPLMSAARAALGL